MPCYRRAHPPEFRHQMIDLVRSRREPEEFEPSAASIAGWARRAEAEDGARPDPTTATECEEMARVRRENRQLRQDRDIQAKATARFAAPPNGCVS